MEIQELSFPGINAGRHSNLPDPFVLKVIVVLLASTLCFLAAKSLTLFLAMILQV